MIHFYIQFHDTTNNSNYFGNITSIASVQAGMTDADHLGVTLALFNTSGRVFTGMPYNKIGGLKTLSLSFMLSIANMMLFPHYTSHISLIIGMATAGLCYGTLPAVFPSLTAGFYGLKNYGTNYGVVYTAWGVSGLIGPVIAAVAVDTTGNYNLAYFYSAIIMGIAFAFSVLIRIQQAKL